VFEIVDHCTIVSSICSVWHCRPLYYCQFYLYMCNETECSVLHRRPINTSSIQSFNNILVHWSFPPRISPRTTGFTDLLNVGDTRSHLYADNTQLYASCRSEDTVRTCLSAWMSTEIVLLCSVWYYVKCQKQLFVLLIIMQTYYLHRFIISGITTDHW